MIDWHSTLSIPRASDMTTAHALGSGPAPGRPHRVTTDVSGHKATGYVTREQAASLTAVGAPPDQEPRQEAADDRSALLAGTIPAHAADCSTFDQQQEVVFEFLDDRYEFGGGRIWRIDEEEGIWEFDFGFITQRGGCTGRVRVADDCTLTDAEGTPLDRANSRERAISCEVSN